MTRRRWIPTDRAVKFGELVDASDLQGTGYVPGTMRVPFRTAPDLYTWRNRAVPDGFAVPRPARPDRGPGGVPPGRGDQRPLSRQPPLGGGAVERAASWFSRLFNFGVTQPTSRVDVPAYEVFGQNDLQFFFDTRPLHRGDCVAIPQDVRMAVDPDSTFDISRAYRFAELPNLAYFVSSGVPVHPYGRPVGTRPSCCRRGRPSGVEVGAFLELMGRIGSLTGYPVVRMAVVQERRHQHGRRPRHPVDGHYLPRLARRPTCCGTRRTASPTTGCRSRLPSRFG